MAEANIKYYPAKIATLCGLSQRFCLGLFYNSDHQTKISSRDQKLLTLYKVSVIHSYILHYPEERESSKKLFSNLGFFSLQPRGLIQQLNGNI